MAAKKEHKEGGLVGTLDKEMGGKPIFGMTWDKAMEGNKKKGRK